MPKILLIDTSASQANIIVSENGKIRALRKHDDAMQQAATINLMIQEILDESCWTMDSIDACSVCIGPGSYTGLRVGLSTAKGICYALNKPLITQSRLQLVAAEHSKQKKEDLNIYVVQKARDKEYFRAIYNTELLEEQLPKHLLEKELMIELQNNNERVWVLSDCILSPEITGNHKVDIIPGGFEINVDYWAEKANSDFIKKKYHPDIAYIEPMYLKQVYTTASKLLTNK